MTLKKNGSPVSSACQHQMGEVCHIIVAPDYNGCFGAAELYARTLAGMPPGEAFLRGL